MVRQFNFCEAQTPLREETPAKQLQGSSNQSRDAHITGMPATAGKQQQQILKQQHATPTIAGTLGPSSTLPTEKPTLSTEKTMIATAITPATAGMTDTARPPTTVGLLTQTRLQHQERSQQQEYLQ
jgi:hypothetical protein